MSRQQRRRVFPVQMKSNTALSNVPAACELQAGSINDAIVSNIHCSAPQSAAADWTAQFEALDAETLFTVTP